MLLIQLDRIGSIYSWLVKSDGHFTDFGTAIELLFDSVRFYYNLGKWLII